MAKPNPYQTTLSSPAFIDALQMYYGSLEKASVSMPKLWRIPARTLRDIQKGHVGPLSSVKLINFYASLSPFNRKNLDTIERISPRLSPRQQKVIGKSMQGRSIKELNRVIGALDQAQKKLGLVPAQVAAHAQAIAEGRYK